MKYYNVINKNKEITFEGEFENLKLFLSSKGDLLLKVKTQEKEKVINFKGISIIDNDYDKISILQKGESLHYYIVYKKNKFGYINEDGTQITEIKFDELSSCHDKEFKNGFALVMEKGIKKFINENGQNFIDVETTDGYGYDNGLALLKKGKLFGFIDVDGKEITGFIFNDAYRFTKYGHGFVAKNGKWGVINNKGDILLDFKFDKINYLDNNSKNEYYKNLIEVRIEKLYGFIDLENKIYSKINYKEIKYSNEAFLIVKKEKSWGVINLIDEEIVPFIYDEIVISKNHVFAKKGGKYEIINLQNKNQVLYKCDNYYLSNETCIIKTKKLYYLIKFKEQNIIELKLNQVDDISCFSENIIIGIRKNKYGILNFNGDILIDFIYEKIKLEFDESSKLFFIVTKDGLMGVLDENHNIILETRYHNIFLEKYYFEARSNKIFELFDKNGKLFNNTKYDRLTSCYIAKELYLLCEYNNGTKISKINYMVARELKNSKNCSIIILNKQVDEFSYIVAVGYAGGGVWGEIMAKISTTNNWDTSKGVFTNYLYDSNWIYKYENDECSEYIDPIDETDAKILKQLEEELFSKYIYYDDDDDDVSDIPLLNKEFKATLKAKTFDSTSSTSIYKNLSKHWGLFYRW